MSFDLHLKAACGGCGSTSDLYGSNCKHLTLCMSCGRNMAQNRHKCYDCGVPVTRLIREYNVRTTTANDKSYFIGRFVAGLPTFSAKKNAEKWSIQKEGLQGRHVTDTLREKFKNKPWLLEDETGQFHYHGQLEGAQSATYYLLVKQQKEFVAIPAGSWYNFNKVAQYKQLTLEEAEEKMKNRRKTADGYERWMMKTSATGPAAFGETAERLDDKEFGGGNGRGHKKAAADDEEGNASDRGDEDEQDDDSRRSRRGLNKKKDDDDGEGRRGGDHDFDDDDIEKGDDWEHEEIFTDDDEKIGDPEEREDLAPEVPAPPEIKQDEEDDDDEANEEEGPRLSKSGKEIKKLLGKTGGLNDSDADDDDDDDDDDDETGLSPVLAPKKKDAVKEEPTDASPSKPATARGTPSTSKSAKGKRKPGGDDVKVSNGGTPPPAKKVKTENESKPCIKDGSASESASKGGPKEAQAVAATGPVTEEQIRAVLMQKAPVTTQELVAKFRQRLKTPKDKSAFAEILKKISKIQKTSGSSYVVLREK